MKNKFVYFLILIALVSGTLWGYRFSDPFPQGDGARYNHMAQLFLEKGVFNNDDAINHDMDRPMYPLFMALIYKIFGQYHLLIKIIQLFLFLILVLLVYRLCQTIFDERLARLAGLATALCYSITSFIGWYSREVFFSFLMVLLVYALYKAHLTNKNTWFILAGIFVALGTLTNAMLEFFPLLIMINFLIIGWKKYGFKEIYPKIVIFFIAFSLVMAPWVISCYLNFDRFFFTAGSGYILPHRVERMKVIEGKYIQHLVGNGLGDFFAYKWFADYNPKESRLGWQHMQNWLEMTTKQKIDRAEVDRILTGKAVNEIKAHPWMYLKLVFIDLLKYNTPMTPNTGMQHMFAETHPELSDFVKGTVIISIRFIYLLFYLLIFYAIIKKLKNWSKISWLVLIILYFNLTFANLIAIARSSMPIYPFYIILASLGIILFWDKIKAKWFNYENKISQ